MELTLVYQVRALTLRMFIQTDLRAVNQTCPKGQKRLGFWGAGRTEATSEAAGRFVKEPLPGTSPML